MKSTYSRRYRRHPSRSREGTMFKKDSNQEQTFFSAPTHESFFKPNVIIQRKCAECEAEDKKVNRMTTTEEEKKVQRNTDHKEKEEEKQVHKKGNRDEEEKKVQRTTDHKEKEEEKKIQKKGNRDEEEKKVNPKKETSSVSGHAPVSTYISSLHSKGNALPLGAQYFFSKRMGGDFSGVKIHAGTEAERSAEEINARAYTVDNHIVFNKGRYDPATGEGKKLLAHELAHVMQNDNGGLINRKVSMPQQEEEKAFTLSGSSASVKNKSVMGNCSGVNVQGRTDFNPLPSTFSVQGGTSRPATSCETCSPPDCITANGIIVSVFRSNPVVTLPPVPGGLTPCETNAVRTFINTTLRNHEQEHVRAFRTYDGQIRTPLNYRGCRSGLQAYVQAIHDGIDTQRSSSAIAQSDALDPFVRAIPCNCP
jgi:flagellar biosynthesis GTPase FlhF